MKAAQAMAAGAVAGEVHVFGGARIDQRAAVIAAMIDVPFSPRWDGTRRDGCLSFAPEHPLLGRPVCRAAGCSTTAPAASRICAACRRRLAEHGLGGDEIAALPAGGCQRSGRGPDACLVDGCAREWMLARSGLCSAHAEQWRALPGAGIEQFLAHREVKPPPPLAFCAVAACTRQRRHPDGRYCEAHQQRLRAGRTHDSRLDESHRTGDRARR